MSTKRKIKKFLRDPKLFFSDMLVKHHKKISFLKGKRKYNGENKFTVISAVYGVEKYLDDYFDSLIKQRLDFKKHIHLVMVDDGSKDNSAEIIKKWQRKYPDNITYIYKENGGQASARNFGLKNVETKWVTFIDPDDFVDLDYFLNINSYLEKSKESIAFIGCNLYFYMEDTKQYKDSHPLKYKFKEEIETLSCLDLKNNVQMSSSSAVFLTNIIRANNLVFNDKIQPSFEDASFISYYLSYATGANKAVFLSKPKYFYRKREDNSSTLDNAWQDARKYNDVFIYGYLPLLNYYNGLFGKVPIHIQRQVLYDLIWYLKYLINSDEKLSFLQEEDINKFHQYFLEAFSFIDEKTILDFDLAGAWFYHKVLILKSFKGSVNFKQISYIERANQIKQEVLISFIADSDADVSFIIDGKDVIPSSYKILPQIFAQQELGAIHYYYINYPDNINLKLKLVINGKISRLNLRGKMYPADIVIADIFDVISQDAHKKNTSWVFMDRDTIADDNAEHLYRYIKDNYPEKEIYYALRKTSKDWNRLYSEGFNLIDFGSTEHQEILAKSGKIISSHAEKYVHNYLPNNEMMDKSFIFLQHGVIKDDLSSWLNSKKNMDVFLTSTYPEYQSIVSKDSSYIFTEREVKLTGLPRHDSLWLNKDIASDSRMILIMPTWRNSIVGELIENSNERVRNNNFETTQFFEYWYSFLHSEELLEIATRYGFKVVFAPHKNIELYIESFDVPSYISIRDSKSAESMQQLFLEASFLITDYSSTAFELAYLNKSTIYYQFDEEEVFSGSHTYQKGYFDYNRDGFGPKVLTESELLIELEKLCSNNGNIEDYYFDRIKHTFAYQDSSNCERVYRAISDLDDSKKDIIVNIDTLEIFAYKSLKKKNNSLAIERFEQLFQVGDVKQIEKAYSALLQLYFQEGKFKKLDFLLSNYDDINSLEKIRIKAHLEYLKGNWVSSIAFFEKINKKVAIDYYYLAICSAYKGDGLNYHSYITVWKTIYGSNKNSFIEKLDSLYQNILTRDWSGVIAIANSLMKDSYLNDIRYFKIELVLAQAYRKTNLLSQAFNLLDQYETHSKSDAECRIEIAHCAFMRKDYTKVIEQLDRAFSNNYSMFSVDSLYEYLESLYKIGNFYLYSKVKKFYKNNDYNKLSMIGFLIKLEELEGQWNNIILYKDEVVRFKELANCNVILLRAFFNLGLYNEGLLIAKTIKNSILGIHLAEYLRLKGDFGILCDDWQVAYAAYKELFSIQARTNDSDWNKLICSKLMIKK